MLYAGAAALRVTRAMNPIHRLVSRGLAFLLPVLVFLLGCTAAMAQADPPARVAGLSWRDGSVVFAPEGDSEWTDLPVNRPLTRGDRIWTDRGARAELQLGSATLHVNGQSHMAFYELDDQTVQLSITQGAINVRVRDLGPRENFEIDTPNLAVRAMQPGDWRVDVDASGVTRVAVRSGQVAVYGERGESVALAGGQQMAFAGRALEQVASGRAGFDTFDTWAADRNRQEDQSLSARYVPREVIGYSQLDNYGNWSQDPGYGAVWFPRAVVADWAPYRYGHWTWIQPWGWTWVDDAPWGFAPSHYGRWALIGSRWAWVPGRMGPRPVYAPALVVFVGGSGGGNDWNFRVGSGPGVAWYPLAPGEAWWPTYRTSNVYITNVNRNIVLDRQARPRHVFRERGEAITAVAVDDFNRGRPVREHWQRVQPSQIANAPVANAIAALPRPERVAPERREAAPRLQQMPPPAAVMPPVPSRGFAPPGLARPMPVAPSRPEEVRNPRAEQERGQREQQERAQQERAQREQEQRQQRDVGARQQQERVQQERAQQERLQQDRVQQERAAREQERQQRDQERQQQRQPPRAVPAPAPAPQAAPQANERPRPQPQQRPQRDDDEDKRGRARGRD